MLCERDLRISVFAVLTLVLASPSAFAARPKPCVTADQASQMLNKDVCLSAHIYDVVLLPDGTRFLDICPPETPDAQCRFTVVSFREDHEAVGELQKYRNVNVRIRGIVQPMHGRAGMILSHSRQFTGGPPRFRPNPLLLHGFSAEQDRPPVYDPALRARGGHRSFMNARDRETPAGK
jgi:hypothetical protein